MPIDSVAAFVRLLGQYGLVEPEQRPQLARLARSGAKDARAFAGDLLRRGWLTAYQINQLFQDNGASLQLGSYVVLERLGSGGMGNVFKARHAKLGRVVALKVIQKDKLNDRNVVRRFDREIEAAAKLDHPNIVHAFDAEEVDGNRVLVMEYIEGADLGKLVKEGGPLPVADACEYVRQAALALQHAFEKGMVHRDIKPSNLMVVASGGRQPPASGGRRAPRSSPHQGADAPRSPGTVKLLDMGLALLQGPLIDGSTAGPLTVAGKVVGTVDYIAPEQARDASTVDVRADLYSLGCTLYYLLTGQPPFEGATVTNKLFKHALEEPEPVERVRREVPPAVAAVVRRLMAKKPEDRFQTPAALAAALDGVLHPRAARDGAADRPAPAPPSSRRAGALPKPAAARPAAATPVNAAVSRRVLLPGAGGAVALLALVAAVIALAGRHSGSTGDDTGKDEGARSPERQAEAELGALRQRALDGAADKGELRQDVLAFRQRYYALPQAVGAAALLRDLPSPLDALDPKKIPPTPLPQNAPPELVAVAHPGAGAATGAVISPGGRYLLMAVRPPTPPPVVAYFDLAEGRLERRFDSVRGEVLALALSPDGTRAVLGGRNGTLGAWDVPTGREQAKKLAGQKGDVLAVAVSPDGKRTLSGGTDKAVRLWRLDGGTVHVLDGHTGAVTAVAFTPDGKQALSAGADKALRLWDVEAHEGRKPDGASATPFTCLAVAPDGKRAYTGGDKGIQGWPLGPLGPPEAVAGHAGPVSSLAITADGRYLAAGNATGWVAVWGLTASPPVKEKEWRLSGATGGLSWALDGRHLAVTAGANGVYVLRFGERPK